MAARTDRNDTHAKLIQLMEDEETIVLSKLARHLEELYESDDEDDSDADEGEGSRQSTGHKRKSSSPRNSNRAGRKKPAAAAHPFARFLRLQSVTMAPVMQQYLERHGVDPVPFLEDTRALKHKRLDFSDTQNRSDAFWATYRWASALVKRRAQDSLRWCFTMMMYYDLTQIIRPQSSGKVGHLMLAQIKDYLGPLQDQVGVPATEVLKQINQWARHGKKLNILCAEFGPGCLSYLAENSLLSEDL
ncbi:MAG: hypothetical protein Q9170_003143 [Blastenia crenularia]